MRNLKKILALVLSLMMVLSVMVTASATDFADDADITNKEAVEVMSALGILSGSQGKFAPKGTLTREQAAKIIAFVKLGADTDALLKGTGSALFADVTSGWAYDYISYCANEGIISGYTVNGAKNFGPKGTLTGYQFGKMVLVAAGVEGTYTGSGWEVNVATALKKANLLTGLETLVLSANVTREQAAQLAFNAMDYSASTTAGYPVMETSTGKVVGYYDTIVEAAAAVTVLGSSNYRYGTEKVTIKSGSILATTWKTTPDSDTDAFGRVTSGWTIDKSIAGTTSDVFVATSVEAPAYTFVASKGHTVSDADTLAEALNAELGLKTNKTKLTASEGFKLNGANAAFADLQAGDVVEVYLGTGKAVAKTIVTRYTFGKVADVKAVKNPSEALQDAGVVSEITVGSEKVYDVEFAGLDYEKNDYILYVLGTSELDSAGHKSVIASKAAETVTGEVDATKDGKLRIGGTYYASALAGSDTLTIGSAGTYALNAAGVISGVVVADTTVTHQYAYIYKVNASAISSEVDDDGFSTAASTEYTAYYVLEDGTKGNSVLAKSTDGKILGVTAPSDTSGLTALAGLYDYTIVNGKLSGTKVTAKAVDNSALAANTRKLGDNYATSATKYVFVNVAANKLTVTVKTGYANAAATGNVDAYAIADNTKIISTVFVVGAPAGDSASDSLYAFLLDAAPVVTKDSDGNTYNTYSVLVDGKETTVTGKGTTITGVGKGGYFEYTLTGGYLTANVTAAVTPGSAQTGKTFVTIVEGYLDDGTNMVKLADDVAVYDVDATTKDVTVISTDDLAVGDTYNYFTATVGGVTTVTVIIRTAKAA